MSNMQSGQKALSDLVDEIEKLEEDKKAVADEIRGVYANAREAGFDTKTLREIIRMRKIPKEVRQDRDAVRDLYLKALGMEE